MPTSAARFADLGDTELAAENMAKAYELRDGVSDRENYFITFTYHRQLTRNLELLSTDPGIVGAQIPQGSRPRGFLSGFTSPGGSLRKSCGRRSKGD